MFFTRCLTKRDSALKDIRRKLVDGATVAALAVREITSERRMAYDYKVRRCNLNDQKYSVTLDGKHFTSIKLSDTKICIIYLTSKTL